MEEQEAHVTNNLLLREARFGRELLADSSIPTASLILHCFNTGSTLF